MARRYYSSTAVATTLSSSASNSDTSIDVTALSGYPVSTPWTAIIDPDTASEEVVEVTNVSGTTLTVTRGVDGTSGVAHSAGAVFRHGVSARDFDEANDHVNDTTTDVHSQYVLKSLIDAKGDIITATADNTPARLAVGTNEHRLVAASGEATGLKYVADTTNYAVAAKGNLLVGTAADTVAALSVGANDTVLVAASGESTGVKWASLTASQIPTLDATKVPTQVQNARTDSYTLVLADAGKLIEMGKATAQTLTVPLNSSVAFPTGTKIDIIQTGAGETTIAATGGVTINSEGSKLKLNAQWAGATLIKRATDTWILIGSLKA